MPKRRVRQTGQRRLGRGSRSRLRLVRELDAQVAASAADPTPIQPDSPESRLLDALFPEGWRQPGGPDSSADSYAPVFGDTWIAADYGPCFSCADGIHPGQEVTLIDGEPNCPSCTEEARRG